MRFIYVLLFFFSTTGAFASMDCEKKLSQHFETLNMEVKKPMKSQDYLNGDFRALGKKAYEPSKKDSKKEAQADWNKLMKAAEAFETTDSRFNEIVRVCSAIRAFAEVGFSSDEIEMKTLPFQNGWSEGMRAPIKDAIKKEIKQLKASNEIKPLCAPSTATKDSTKASNPASVAQ